MFTNRGTSHVVDLWDKKDMRFKGGALRGNEIEG